LLISIRKLVQDDPTYRVVYERARASRQRVTTVYDLSSRCNLFCEGCLYFNRDGGHPGNADSTTGEFDALFAAEKLRGVNYPVFGGAEPTLQPALIRQAARHWNDGMIHTNGTRRIDAAIPFRILVSLWGGPELSRAWRGGDNYEKAMRQSVGDQRILMNYTVNAQNIDDIHRVVSDCAKRGLKITFQGFSPTADYTNYLKGDGDGRHDFIQSDSKDINLAMTPDKCAASIVAIGRAIDQFPETVVFTKALARWTFEGLARSVKGLPDNAAPKECIAATDARHRHYFVDGQQAGEKSCGHGQVDCRTCKTYTFIFPSFFGYLSQSKGIRSAGEDYLKGHAVFDYVYNGHNRPDWRGIDRHAESSASSKLA